MKGIQHVNSLCYLPCSDLTHKIIRQSHKGCRITIGKRVLELFHSIHLGLLPVFTGIFMTTT